jgi:hypothetical protein
MDLMQTTKNLFGTINGLTSDEIKQLEAWDANERDSLLAWLRWSRGKKFKGGIREKMAAKTGFLASFNIVMAVHGLKEPTNAVRLFLDEQIRDVLAKNQDRPTSQNDKCDRACALVNEGQRSAAMDGNHLFPNAGEAPEGTPITSIPDAY